MAMPTFVTSPSSKSSPSPPSRIKSGWDLRSNTWHLPSNPRNTTEISAPVENFIDTEIFFCCFPPSLTDLTNFRDSCTLVM